MKKQILAFLLVLALFAALPLSASADAYIPPEEVYGYDILVSHNFNNVCKPLNVFLSNFAEIGLTSYSDNVSDRTVAAYVLKHLELNAQYYSGDVTKITGEDGKTYMKVSEDIFNSRSRHLFGRSIDISTLNGYTGDGLLVSSDHFGGPIQVFASVYQCGDLGGGYYSVLFDVFLIEKDFSGWYTLAHGNLPMDNLSLLGSGSATIFYPGGETEDSISSSDFSLIELTADLPSVPCSTPNLPYAEEQTTEPPAETEIPTQAPTEQTEAPATEAPAEEAEEREEISSRNEKEETDFDNDETSSSLDVNKLLLFILIGAVVLLVLIALAALLLRKRK